MRVVADESKAELGKRKRDAGELISVANERGDDESGTLC